MLHISPWENYMLMENVKFHLPLSSDSAQPFDKASEASKNQKGNLKF